MVVAWGILVNIRISAHSYLLRISSNCSVKFFNNLLWWVSCAENCDLFFFAIFGKNHLMIREKVYSSGKSLKQAIGLNMLRGPQ